MFPELGREYLQERQDGTLKPEKLLPVGEKGAQSAMATEIKIQVHGETYEVAVTGVGVSSSDQKKIHVSLYGVPQTVLFKPLNEHSGGKGSGRKKASEPGHVSTAMPGNIVEVLVKEGDIVSAGQAVLFTEGMKTETERPANIDGLV